MKLTPAAQPLPLVQKDVTKAQPKVPSAEVKAAREFEALLIRELYATMRQTVPQGESSDMGRSVFDGMLDEQLAQYTAESGGFGLADAILKQMDGPSRGDAPTSQVFGQPVDDPDTRGGKT